MIVLRELANWLGEWRWRLLVVLFALTLSLTLLVQFAFGGESWQLTVQLGLVWLFLLVLLVVLGSRMQGNSRRSFLVALGPALLLLGIGLFVPDYALTFAGAAFGWMIAAQIILRNRVRMEYQTAVKHLRKNEITQALASMDDLIAAEPHDPNHYRFRAELYRLADRVDRAEADYRKVVTLTPDAPAGYIGLAEVAAQQGDFALASRWASQAAEKAPHDWLAAYTLGLVSDRLHEHARAIQHLTRAQQLGLPDSRYRLLTHLWLARNYYGQGQIDDAQREMTAVRQQQAGWRAWQVILESEQAAALRRLLAADVALAGRVIEGSAGLDDLASSSR